MFRLLDILCLQDTRRKGMLSAIRVQLATEVGASLRRFGLAALHPSSDSSPFPIFSSLLAASLHLSCLLYDSIHFIVQVLTYRPACKVKG
jgi:hypothetical protein